MGLIRCASSTAENMLQRASVRGESILITGASGGVRRGCGATGRLRGADVWAMTQPAKADAVTALGPIISARRALPTRQFDVVIDRSAAQLACAAEQFETRRALCHGGAIAGQLSIWTCARCI
jgi:NADPH:quinone reductase-like Zn-dependent oxidoreductase